MADEGWTYVNAYATTNGDSNVHHYMMKRTVPAEEPAVAAEPFTAHGASIELTAPWVDLKLPVGNGEVVLSDDIQLSVVYRGAKQTELHKTYGNAIKARGWEHHVENDVTAAITTQFKKDGRTLVLTVAASVGFTTVSVIILDF
jgi:hypothetical protein